MHELSIAQNIIETANKIMIENKANRVLSIEIKIGEISGVIKESLEFYYQILTKDLESFKDSKLIIEETEWKMKCRDCNYEYRPEENSIGCPNCKSLESKIISGKELDLISLEVE